MDSNVLEIWASSIFCCAAGIFYPRVNRYGYGYIHTRLPDGKGFRPITYPRIENLFHIHLQFISYPPYCRVKLLGFLVLVASPLALALPPPLETLPAPCAIDRSIANSPAASAGIGRHPGCWALRAAGRRTRRRCARCGSAAAAPATPAASRTGAPSSAGSPAPAPRSRPAPVYTVLPCAPILLFRFFTFFSPLECLSSQIRSR